MHGQASFSLCFRGKPAKDALALSGGCVRVWAGFYRRMHAKATAEQASVHALCWCCVRVESYGDGLILAPYECCASADVCVDAGWMSLKCDGLCRPPGKSMA